MTGLTLREVSLADAALVEEWHGVYARADRYDRETATPWTLPEVRAAMANPDPGEDRVVLAGLVAGRVVAAGWAEWPTLDNPELALVQAYVDPPARRRGYGSAMLAALEERSRERSRTVMLAEVRWGYELGTDGEGSPGAAFARARGYGLALGEVQSRLALPVAADLLDRLAAEADAHTGGYTLRGFTGPVPDDLLEAYAALDSAVDTEAPTGDLAIEPTKPDRGVVRAQNDRLTAQRRTRCATFAFPADGSGDPAAYTEILVAGHEPGRAYQWGTLVRREHRGHRLGLAVKAANLRQLHREFPDLTEVVTWNAEDNAHMIGINRALGFVPVGRMGEFQRRW